MQSYQEILSDDFPRKLVRNNLLLSFLVKPCSVDDDDDDDHPTRA